ncbi:MAG: ATP synthase F1 subunit epsilon [Myxococcales bacterium]|nr:ATP synthase F1 subunit epsilon [Myxococcales bacterium]USN50026.1 MAG: ATP synthase F1 subunit epsilon [Myxococcales bacterium]
MLHLNVVTPERPFIEQDCLSVTLPGLMGEVQILEGHTPCLLELKTGHVIYENKDRESVRFMIAAGFVEVDKDHVTVMCEMARSKDEIDKVSELGTQQDLKQQLDNTKLDEEEKNKRLQAELEKSVARMSLLD